MPLSLHPLGEEHTIRLFKRIPGLDHPEDPLPSRGRPLDLADRRRLHPAASGQPAGRRPPAYAMSATAMTIGSETTEATEVTIVRVLKVP